MTLLPVAAKARLPRSLSLRAATILFAAAVMLPLLAHAAVNISQSFTTARLDAEGNRIAAATRTAAVIESRIAAIRTAAAAAAGSATLARGDLAAYVGELRLITAALALRSASLYDAQGTAIAQTEPGRAPPVAVDQLAAATGRAPELTDAAAPPGAVRSLAVVAPVPLPQGGSGWLAFEITPQIFATLGLDRMLDPGEVLTVRDRAGRLFWRSYPHAVGEQLPHSMAGTTATPGGSGVLRDISILTNEARTLAFTHAAAGALLVTSSMPSKLLYQSMPLGSGGTIALALASIAGSVALALIFSRYLVKAFRRAALGQDADGIALVEAEALGDELRADRHSLLGTLSSVALLEMHWRGAGPARLHFSPHFAALMGVDAGALGSAEAIVRLFDERDRSGLEAAMAQAAIGGGTFSLLLRRLQASNRLHWFRLIGVGTVAAGGRAGRLVLTLEDVTQAFLAAHERAVSEQRLRMATDAAELGIWEVELATGRRYFSDRLWRMIGLEPRETGLAPDETMALIHPDDRAGIPPLATVLSQPLTDIAYRIVRPDGGVRHFSVTTTVVTGEDGQPTHVIGVVADVTRQKEAELEVRSHASQLALAAEIADIGIWERDQGDGRMRWIKTPPVFAKLQEGRSFSFPQDLMALIHEGDRERLQRDWGQVDLAAVEAQMYAPDGTPLDTSARQEIEFRGVMLNGAVRHIQAKRVFLRGPSGGITRTIGVFADITDRLDREREIAEREARFRLAIETANLGVWDYDPATGVTVWSPRMWELRGLVPAPPPVPLELIVATTHPDDRARVEGEILSQRAGERPGLLEKEYRVLRPDGTARIVLSRSIAIHDGAGRLQQVIGVNQDITGQKGIEQELRDNALRFELATKAAGLGVWEQDLATGQVRWSDRMWLIHGLVPRDEAPSPAEQVALLHPDDAGIVAGLHARLLGQAGSHVEAGAYRILRPDGSTRHVETRVLSVCGEGEEALRLIGVVSDVTEVQELRAQATVAGNVATLGQLAGGIAHELAQPLQAMIAAAEACSLRLSRAEDAAAVDYARDRLGWISGQAARAGRTIQHLLAFSRGTSTSGVTSLAEAVAGSLELVGRNLALALVEVEVEVPHDLPLVLGGLVEVEQVLVNLLLNARDALEPCEARRVAIRGASHGDKVVLTLSDTGGGVPPEILSRIFDPFFTTKPTGKGTGLGLAISQKTMIALGGSIAVRNTGEGAEFTLVFQALRELV